MTASIGPTLAIFAVFAMTMHSLAAAEPTLDKWDAARESFTATRERLMELSLKAFDVAETRARKGGDAVLVERIRRDRVAFTASGIPPRHVALPHWIRGMQSAVTSLKQVAQRTTGEFVREGRNKDAAKVEAQLAELLGPPPPPIPVIGGADPRFYWVNTQRENHFRLLATGDWEEYVPSDGRKMIWKEISRDRKSIELFDPARRFAMRLQATNGHVDFSFDGSEPPQYGHWSDGRWQTAAEAITYLDAEDDAAEATKQAAAKALK